MTLHEYLSATSAVPAPALRRAMTAALSVEPARTPDACRRFYSRVVHELGLATEDAASGTPAERGECGWPTDDRDRIMPATSMSAW